MSTTPHTAANRKKRYPYLPSILFTMTYLLVLLYHHDYILFGFTLTLVLSSIGIYYTIKASTFRSRYRSTTLVNIDDMTEIEFQELLIPLFRRQGYSVNQTKANEKNKADLILRKRGVKAVVYAKRQNAMINKQTIQKALTTKPHYQATQVIVITNSTFTNAAKQLAHANKINLIDRDSLDAMLDAYFQQKRSDRFIHRVRTFFVSQESSS